MHPAFLQRLANSQRVLLVGAGGGFDIYCGLPLFENLRSQGKQVFLASLNFRSPAPEWGPRVFPGVVCLQGDVSTDLVSAEVCLSRFLVAEHMDTAVYCFEAQGVLGLLECYRSLAHALAIDAIVLVDGGTDILLRGMSPAWVLQVKMSLPWEPPFCWMFRPNWSPAWASDWMPTTESATPMF